VGGGGGLWGGGCFVVDTPVCWGVWLGVFFWVVWGGGGWTPNPQTPKNTQNKTTLLVWVFCGVVVVVEGWGGGVGVRGGPEEVHGEKGIQNQTALLQVRISWQGKSIRGWGRNWRESLCYRSRSYSKEKRRRAAAGELSVYSVSGPVVLARG